MSIILGINAFHPGSSACLLIDGKPLVAIAEERLNRIKYFAGFPELAIKTCLKIASLKITDVDYIAVPKDSNSNLYQKVKYSLSNPSKIFNLIKIKGSSNKLSQLKPILSKIFDLDLSALKFKQYNIEHHVAHIASAYFISNWDKSAGFSLDGSGDFVSTMFADCYGNNIDVKHRVYVPNSLGSFYTMISQFIGHKNFGDEGKVMGLAPYGTNAYKYIFDEIIKIKDLGFKLNHKYFKSLGSNQGIFIDKKGKASIENLFSNLVLNKFGSPTKPHSKISKRDMNLAFSLQNKFEEVYLSLLNQLHKIVPNEKVSMGGGATLNSVANGKIFERTPFKETCIQPAAGDDGLSLGAALYVHNSVLKNENRYVMKGSYLGPEYSDEEIEKILNKYDLSYKKFNYDKLIQTTVNSICNDEVIGWFQGKMEWGPRALGNRSIIANPGSHNMKDILNSRIKKREWYRPFAPAILVEDQNLVFEYNHPSPHMMHVYKIRKEWRYRLPAVNHIDNTARLQTVSKEENYKFYDLINEFKRKTGIPLLLNTSFNENEPIVCNPDEAVNCFVRTKMDLLVIGNFIIKKNKN
tara:strand:+ start:13205 stop:14941 length:1737 start_codon:yes stop_codon:yes gene_type:complete